MFVQPDDRYLRRVMGSRIRQLRQGRGLSQCQLAEVLGCQQGWISKVESGSSRVSPAQLRSLCLVLGVSADYLLSL
jgi:transcriptional regulator with XRE-family HTH domain